jgi:hypothetical protein
LFSRGGFRIGFIMASSWLHRGFIVASPEGLLESSARLMCSWSRKKLKGLRRQQLQNNLAARCGRLSVRGAWLLGASAWSRRRKVSPPGRRSAGQSARRLKQDACATGLKPHETRLRSGRGPQAANIRYLFQNLLQQPQRLTMTAASQERMR